MLSRGLWVGRRNPSLRPSTCLSASLALPCTPPVFAITIKRQHPGPRSTDWRLGLTKMWRDLGMLCVCLCVCVCVPVSQLSVHLCVYTTSLCMCSMFQCQKLMCEFLCLCLFLSISRFYLYICVCTVLMWSVGLSDREGVCMECSISMTTSLNNNAITHFN